MNKKVTKDSQENIEQSKSDEAKSIILSVPSRDGKTQRDIIFQTLDEADKYLILYEKHTQIEENKKDSEHKRDLENRQQTQIEEKDRADRGLQAELEREKIKLDQEKEKNQEIDRQHRRELEIKQQSLNQITIYLSFAIALVGIILAFTVSTTAGGAIAAAALAIPTSMRVFDFWRNRKEGEK